VPVRICPPDEAALAEAVARLRAGGLVAFPTETVYGLGASALSADAVQKIFDAKGRPASNPLIVHVACEADARALARAWPDEAQRLATAHWPGPLTLVVEKTDAIPALVTAGGNTVGLRVPNHPVALALLRAAGLPLAAPSANRSEEISPTTAQHVADSLGPFVEDLLILDGGPCAVGIESTVVDVTGDVPRVLRPGMVRVSPGPVSAPQPPVMGGTARSPGQSQRHYAPRKPLVLVRDLPALGPTDGLLRLPEDPAQAASMLYAELRRLDADPSVGRIFVMPLPESTAWDALRDRLERASR
jgi:L-threonylcarbamoyladenylate synthase